MKVLFKDTDINTNCIVFNSVIDDFGIIVNHEDGYNVLCMNKNKENYNDVVGSYLIYNKPLTIDELSKDNKAVPSIIMT